MIITSGIGELVDPSFHRDEVNQHLRCAQPVVTGTHGPADLKPLLHTWSLAVEEQFYVIWPFLMFALSKVRWRMRAYAMVIMVAQFLYKGGMPFIT